MQGEINDNADNTPHCACGAAATAAAFGSVGKSLIGHAAAPPIGKQAPGWYRYKVGEFEVTVVTDDVANASKADINAALAADFMPPDRVTGAFTPAVEMRSKLYEMAAAEKMLVQGYHFCFPSVGYIEKSGNGYRLNPAPWNPVI